MPIRKIQLEKDNIYHIYNRWLNKQFIFRNKYDYERFIKNMIKYNKVFDGIKIYSYCLLPNHFHMIVSSSKSGLEISNFMWKIQQAYAMYYKTTLSPDLKSRGQLFEWRFKAKYIKDEAYLYQCMAYVNFNPLKHELVKDINDYPYTSYHQLTKKEKINQYQDMILDELEF